MCKNEKEVSVLDAIEKARKAQQRYLQQHDVQLEIDFEKDDKESQKKHRL